jgi:hypothetical protein
MVSCTANTSIKLWDPRSALNVAGIRMRSTGRKIEYRSQSIEKSMDGLITQGLGGAYDRIRKNFRN